MLNHNNYSLRGSIAVKFSLYCLEGVHGAVVFPWFIVLPQHQQANKWNLHWVKFLFQHDLHIHSTCRYTYMRPGQSGSRQTAMENCICKGSNSWIIPVQKDQNSAFSYCTSYLQCIILVIQHNAEMKPVPDKLHFNLCTSGGWQTLWWDGFRFQFLPTKLHVSIFCFHQLKISVDMIMLKRILSHQ